MPQSPLMDEHLLQVHKADVDWLSGLPCSPQDPPEGVELICQSYTVYIPLSVLIMFHIKWFDRVKKGLRAGNSGERSVHLK